MFRYSRTIRIGSVVYITRPNDLAIDVYDPDRGSVDGVPSSTHSVAREEFPLIVRSLLASGTLVA